MGLTQIACTVFAAGVSACYHQLEFVNKRLFSTFQSMARADSLLAIACLALMAITRTEQMPDKKDSVVYESTPRYNSLPWHFTIEKLYAFAGQ
jgi:hypothetical protein